MTSAVFDRGQRVPKLEAVRRANPIEDAPADTSLNAARWDPLLIRLSVPPHGKEPLWANELSLRLTVAARQLLVLL